jgi:hypothetical protein
MLRNAPWQRLLSQAVFGFIGFVGLAAVLKALLPGRVSVIGRHGETPIFLFLSGLALAAGSLYALWHTGSYRLYPDEEGITQWVGLAATRVRSWEAAPYRREPLRGTPERCLESVLRDGAGGYC